MASAFLFELAKRQLGDDCCTNCDFNGICDCNCDSTWNRWGRWVALVVIIVVAVIFAFIVSCLSARYRRRNNRRPYYGTGWLAKPPAYDAYPQSEYYGGGPAPPYGPGPIQGQQTGNTFNSNEGYYGNHPGYEMQPPQNVYYQSGQTAYHPVDSAQK